MKGMNDLKPKLGVLFPQIMDSEISELQVEKISVSKNRRKIKILLGSDTSSYLASKIESALKKACNLSEVIVAIKEPDKEIDRNVMIYEVERGQENKIMSESAGTEYVGKADVSSMLYGRPIKDSIVSIRSINDNSGRVTISGKVFFVDERSITSKKTGKEFHLVTMDITDNSDSISAKLFIRKNDDDAPFNKLYSTLKKGVKGGGVYVVARGKAQYDEYAGETIIMLNDIAEIGKPPVRPDNAPKKRVELHLHTQMSAMDAVSPVEDLVNRAIFWGHEAIAVTDHGVVQSFPDAMKASGFNEKIKIIYGVEGYLVDDSKKIVYGNSNADLDTPFVVFDIETTGLDKNKNNITEIGAVKVVNGEIVDKWSTFVNPCQPIPENIVDLTGINDNMVKDAPKIGEILPDFFEFAKDCILVAHNASFDIGFIKKAAKDMGLDFDFTCLDTLMLARGMYPQLPNFKLDTITRHLHVILENHHRAVDDAKATADMFVKMINQLKEEGKTQINKLNEEFDLRSASKKNKAFHIIILAKNQTGLRHIYEMVSQSHLKYFHRNPKIPRSLLEEKREGLILGAACEAGEFFRAVVEGKSDEELQEIAEFYDYLEIQPIGNNAYMKTDSKHPHINTDEDLMNLNRRVVMLGEKFNKPVAATCDVHFMDKEGADYRKILMNYKGYSDADNQAPLYFRTTDEMLEEFEYLGKPKAYEVVVKNTNLIADMIEDVRPIPEKKCPPIIDGAKEGIVNDSLNRAKEIYGDPLPDVVQKRLDKELYSITTYGFSVMYRIAQELVRHSLNDGYLVGSRGSVGSSFVAFLSDITEVNSLQGHYICPNCKNVEFIDSEIGLSGCDLEDKVCPKCGTQYKKDGHDIPFETFLGFKGDKEPDIDLNFSGVYQPTIHKYTETFFGEGKVFRAGTIGTVAEKTAFGYVRKYCEEKGITMRNAEMMRLAKGCEGVKRTSGQHPGGIIVVPFENDIHEFCPVQHPADDVNSDIITTHFDYHKIDQNLLKLDELGHDDPTVIRMLEDITGVKAKDIPMDDPETMSLFTSNKALKLLPGEDIGTKLGTYGVPEFGTKFVRQMLEDTKPTTFSELVRISGLSHGTDVWLGNAQELIREGKCDLSHSICARDDIMIYLISCGVQEEHAFKIMEMVRKGKGLTPEYEQEMHDNNVPDWYIESCKKIKYMFPKAHAVAYVMSAVRIAYFKVHYPEAFYIAYFSVRADDFDASIMARGMDRVREEIRSINEKKKEGTVTPKEENLIPVLEICVEMYARGINFIPVDLYKSDATNFLKTDDGILPPLNALPGLSENDARSIVEERANGEFRNVEDLRLRTGIGKNPLNILEANGCFDDLPDTDQVSLFD
ncbi:MAG: PolC-type DNA polymerase III [Oscillospiraceae bacterium]|nr:PolC-type DNA polymerase III [Oscillospiraceae bacterium]